MMENKKVYYSKINLTNKREWIKKQLKSLK